MLLNVNEDDPRIIQQQAMLFAYNTYKDTVYNDPVGKDRYETANRIGDLFGVDPSFFIYADSFGAEVALEYFMNAAARENESMRRRILDAFNDSEDKKEG